MTSREKRMAIRRLMLDFADRLADVLLDETAPPIKIRPARLPSVDTTLEDEQDAARYIARARRT